DGTYAYVQAPNGQVVVGPAQGHVHPGILGNGMPAAGAGEIIVQDSVVTEVNNISFTFQFGGRSLLNVLRACEIRGGRVSAKAAAEGAEYRCTWGSAVMEGAHHGFRLQKTPDRGVVISRLEGCLGMDGDVAGIIWAAMMGVVLLLGGDGSQVEMPGWRTTKC